MLPCKLYAIWEILLLSRNMPFRIHFRLWGWYGNKYYTGNMLSNVSHSRCWPEEGDLSATETLVTWRKEDADFVWSGYVCRFGIDRNADPFACASTYSSNTYLSISEFRSTTASSSPYTLVTTSRTVTFLARTDNYVEAYGVIVRRAAGDPEWSSTSSTTASTASSAEQTGTTSSDEQTGTTSSTSTSTLATSASEAASSGGGLSAGASAGIGVGVAIGCIIFISCIVAAYIIGKRRRKNAKQGPDGAEDPPREDGILVQEQSAPLTVSEYKPWEQPGGGYQQGPEMDGHGYTREMDGQGYTREMDGDGYTREVDGHGYRREMDANNHPIELQGSEGHG